MSRKCDWSLFVYSVLYLALLASCLGVLGGLSRAQVKIALPQFSVASMVMTTALKCTSDSHKLLFCVSMEYSSVSRSQ